MLVRVFAKSEENKSSPGKTSWLESYRLPEITFSPDSPWKLHLKASDSRDLASGLRGGDMRSTNYEAEVVLSADEVLSVIDTALSAGLLQLATRQLLVRKGKRTLASGAKRTVGLQFHAMPLPTAKKRNGPATGA